MKKNSMDSSQNWDAIHTEVLEHETNTGYSLTILCYDDLENRLRISEMHSQISLPESISMHVFHRENILSPIDRFEVVSRPDSYGWSLYQF